jgi:hypothetical protein
MEIAFPDWGAAKEVQLVAIASTIFMMRAG